MKNKKMCLAGVSVTLVLLFLVMPLQAKEAGSNAGDLAKKSQNPVADMISLPLQYNTYLNTGPEGDRTQDVLLVQPVMPVAPTPTVNHGLAHHSHFESTPVHRGPGPRVWLRERSVPGILLSQTAGGRLDYGRGAVL